MAPVIVNATLQVAGAILAESGLSFLGFGVQPPTPSWGNILMGGKTYMMLGNVYYTLFPGMFIFISLRQASFRKMPSDINHVPTIRTTSS